jgi:hypothetical protein
LEGRRKLNPEAKLTLTVEALDLGPDVKAIGLALVDGEEQEPVSGADAAQVWSRAFGTLAGEEPWVLDFFSHVEQVEEFCRVHDIAMRETAAGGLAITESDPEALAELFERFERETFGVRAGGAAGSGDVEVEAELRRRGLDAYHRAYPRYLYCAICELETGSVTLVSEQLWASEVARRLRPALRSLPVSVEMLM